ncbi:MAG TPA: pilus assembly protein PilM [Candidatus Acidoferrales bacterium]|nr:pilus assembly protein PilM [Candidatus Acidoferrales bacterium]
MRDWKTLPLGVDIGITRLRVALGEAGAQGAVRLRAVVSRDVPDEAVGALGVEQAELVAAVIEEILLELGTRESRCVLALSAPACVLRTVRLPKMSWAERLRAARFEAQRFATWDMGSEDSVVRVHPLDRTKGIYAIGVARKRSVDARVSVARMAGLRAIAVDHDALAMRRIFGECDAVVDIGSDRSSLHVFGPAGPLTLVAASGGATITQGIAADLSIDLPAAERRKRILGCAGAGTAAREEVVASIVSLIERARTRAAVGRIVLTGNGARIPGLAQDLERASGALTQTPVPQILQTSAYPDDVVRVASLDWALAAGLLSWGVAA